MPQDERLLLQQAARGDGEAFNQLFIPLLPGLANFINTILQTSKEDTEDIIQDILIKIWLNPEILSGIDVSFKNYLFTMARNKILDKIKRDRIRQKHEKGQFRTIDLQGETADKPLYDKGKRIILLKVIGQMPSTLQEAARLKWDKGWTTGEIAEALGIPPDTARKRLKKVQKFLWDHYLKKK